MAHNVKQCEISLNKFHKTKEQICKSDGTLTGAQGGVRGKVVYGWKRLSKPPRRSKVWEYIYISNVSILTGQINEINRVYYQ